MFATILDPVNFDTHAVCILLHISMSSQAHWLGGSYLVAWATIVRVLLINRHSLVYISLHYLIIVLFGRCYHAFVASLTRVSDTLDRLTLSRCLHTILEANLWCLRATMRCIRLGEASIIDILAVLDLTLSLFVIAELASAIELPRASWHGAIRSLRLVALILGLSIT